VFPPREARSWRDSNIDLYANHVTCVPRFHETSVMVGHALL